MLSGSRWTCRASKVDSPQSIVRALLSGISGTDYALTYPRHSSVRTLRQDDLTKVWCNAARCTVVASAVKPKSHEMQMQTQADVRRHKVGCDITV